LSRCAKRKRKSFKRLKQPLEATKKE